MVLQVGVIGSHHCVGWCRQLKKKKRTCRFPVEAQDVPFGEEGNYFASLVRMNAKRPLNDNLTQEIKMGPKQI